MLEQNSQPNTRDSAPKQELEILDMSDRRISSSPPVKRLSLGFEGFPKRIQAFARSDPVKDSVEIIVSKA